MDLVGSLPTELSLKILEYLGPEQLGLCSLVSRRWRALSSCNHLWKKFSPENEFLAPAEPEGSESDEVSSWSYHKRCYSRWALSRLKWKTGRYKETDLDPRGSHAIIGNGGLLVEVVGTRMSLYDMNERCTRSEAWQQWEVLPEGLEPAEAETITVSCFSENTVCLLAGGRYVLVYGYTPESGLRFLDCLYADYRLNGYLEDVYISSFTRNGPPVSAKQSRLISWDRLLLVEGSLYLVLINANYELYIWSLADRKCTAALAEFPFGFREVATDRRALIFVCCLEGIFVYNCAGMLELKVEYGFLIGYRTNISMYFNENAVMCVEDEDNWHAAWGWSKGELKRLGGPFKCSAGGGILHPTLPAVCYPRVTVEGHTFVAVDLRTKSIIWETASFDGVYCEGPIFREDWNFVILDNRYLAYFYMSEWPMMWYLVDLETGSVLANNTLFPNESPSYFKYCRSKIIISLNNKCVVFT